VLPGPKWCSLPTYLYKRNTCQPWLTAAGSFLFLSYPSCAKKKIVLVLMCGAYMQRRSLATDCEQHSYLRGHSRYLRLELDPPCRLTPLRVSLRLAYDAADRHKDVVTVCGAASTRRMQTHGDMLGSATLAYVRKHLGNWCQRVHKHGWQPLLLFALHHVSMNPGHLQRKTNSEMWYCDDSVCVFHSLEVCGDFLSVWMHLCTLPVHSASTAVCVCACACACVCVCVCISCSRGTEARCDVAADWWTVTAPAIPSGSC